MLAGKRIARPGSIGELARGERIVKRQAGSAEGKVAVQLVGRGRLAGEGRRFLFDQLLIAEEEEGLVPAVVDLGNRDGPLTLASGCMNQAGTPSGAPGCGSEVLKD